jgi:hypothetical protein
MGMDGNIYDSTYCISDNLYSNSGKRKQRHEYDIDVLGFYEYILDVT